MDLSSMLNDGPGPRKPPQSASPEIGRGAPPSIPPTPGANGHASAGEGVYAASQRTPLHGPLPPGASLSRSNTGLTPLQTPAQSQNGQYPFPQQFAPSPATAAPPGQQYRQHEGYPANAPGARPLSHGYPYAQPSPSHGPPTGVPSAVYQHVNASLSPTPPSHHGQNTPHSMRQSPMSVMSQSIHQPPPQHHYQHSQPSTPLGPPALHYQRTSYHGSHPDVHSPYHQRTLSGTSNGIVSGSPAQHHPSIGNLVESPSAYNHQPRRTSEYLAQMDRERSVSVSPKTKVPPRPPSLSSRHSSQQELYGSARSSMQAPSAAEAPRHVSHPQAQAQAQNMAHLPHSRSSDGATQSNSVSTQSPYPYSAAAASATSTDGAPLSQQTTEPSTSQVQHQTQKMGMHHLLTPTNSISSVDGVSEALSTGKQKQQQQANLFMKPSPKAKKPAAAAPPPSQRPPEVQPAALDAMVVDDAAQPRSVSSSTPEEKAAEQPASESKKRAADSDPSAIGEPPAKRGKVMRKHKSRPVWARLKPDNPLYRGYEHTTVSLAPEPSASARAAHKPNASQPPTTNSAPQPQANGHATANGTPIDAPPWLQNPPLDQDLIHCRRVLGQWEKTIKWNTPYPDMLRVVQDWLFQQLTQLGDVGNDPLEGTIEIEAKIGKIIRKGGDDSDRLRLPVMSATVLSPAFNDQIRFESQMEMHEHAAMNNFLNTAIRASAGTPGRIPMQYSHPKQTDSFRTLSPAGIQALPQAFQRRPFGRELKLRTSVDSQTTQVQARIVKIGVADLHIYNPSGDYDCRISINLEVNLERPGLHPEDLFEPPTVDKPAPPDRKKDRLSYKHLNTYSIDLTRVDVQGIAPKFELELEVDSRVLRQQMELMARGEPHAYGDVVSGFLDNATFLMRCRAGQPPG